MRVVLNLIMGGLGSGIAVAAYLLSLAGGISQGDLILPYLTSGAAVIAAMACVWSPVGPRWRNARALRRPDKSWMAAEAYAAIALFGALAVFVKRQSPLFEFVVFVCAAIFLIAQAYTIQSSKSRLYWRAREIPSLIVLTGLSQGVGLLAVLGAVAPPIFRAFPLAPITGITLAMMSALLWRDYASATAPNDTDADGRSTVGRLTPMIHVSAHGLPLALYLAALAPWWPAPDWGMAAGGASAMIGGAYWLNILVTRLGRSRAFVPSPFGL